MFELFKKHRRANKSKAMKEANKLDYDEKDRAQISVGLKTAEDFFSPYSFLTYEFMNPDVAEYIEFCEMGIPKADDISLDFYTEEATDNYEKRRIRAAVKRHYAEKLVSLNKKLKSILITGIIYLLSGLLLLVSDIFFDIGNIAGVDVFIEVIIWILIWDGLDKLFVDSKEVSNMRETAIRFINAKVHVKKYPLSIQREYGIGEYEEDDEDDE